MGYKPNAVYWDNIFTNAEEKKKSEDKKRKYLLDHSLYKRSKNKDSEKKLSGGKMKVSAEAGIKGLLRI